MMKLLGIAGSSGSGKTTLMVKLIPLLTARGLKIATVKHAHHDFDVDVPGKDSWEHRHAGACEVIVASSRRWAQIHEIGDAPEPRLAGLLRRLSPCDLVLVEGYKREPYPKIEVHRTAAGRPPLYPHDPFILAVITDAALPAPHPPAVDIQDMAAVAEAALRYARPLPQVLTELAR